MVILIGRGYVVKTGTRRGYVVSKVGIELLGQLKSVNGKKSENSVNIENSVHSVNSENSGGITGSGSSL